VSLNKLKKLNRDKRPSLFRRNVNDDDEEEEVFLTKTVGRR
jgi:hypothetical protein